MKALRKRVGPGNALHYKHVAQFTRRNPRTVEAWCNGYGAPNGDDLMLLIRHLDPMFGPEVFEGTGFMVVRMADARRAKEVSDALAVLARATA